MVAYNERACMASHVSANLREVSTVLKDVRVSLTPRHRKRGPEAPASSSRRPREDARRRGRGHFDHVSGNIFENPARARSPTILRISPHCVFSKVFAPPLYQFSPPTMPLYEMLCITTHVSTYVSRLKLLKLIQVSDEQPIQAHIRELVRQSATHVMNNGGVVRNINSWGTLTLPQRMKRHGPLQSVGECVVTNPGGHHV